MARDYILRLIDQVAQMLEEVLALRKLGRNTEAIERLAVICLQTIGLPLDLVRHSSPETILQLLESGGGTQHVRAVMLAELLLQDAQLSETKGKNREAAVSCAQARALLAHSIESLSPEEQAVYRPKLEALNEQMINPSSNN